MVYDCDRDEVQRYGPFELRDGENLLSLRDIRYSPEVAQMGYYNDTEFSVKVVLGEFAGVGDFECNWKEFLCFVAELKELYDFRRYEVEFRDIEWGSWLKFVMSRWGHLTISGHLYGATLYTLDFDEFRTDQTILQSFLQQIMKQLS